MVSKSDQYVLVRRATCSMYSFLFSLVTSISRPPGFRSITRVSPKLSSSVEKVKNRLSEMSFSLP